MCPAPKSCHPSQCSATCNLFCLRVSHYVSARINCIVRFSHVPAASASAPIFAEGLISDAASVFKGIGHWAGFIIFLESFLLSFSAVSHWELLQDCCEGCTRAGCAALLPGWASLLTRHTWEHQSTRAGVSWGLGAAGSALRVCWDTAPVATILRGPEARGQKPFSVPHLQHRWEALWHFPREFPWEMKARGRAAEEQIIWLWVQSRSWEVADLSSSGEDDSASPRSSGLGSS